MSSEIKMKMKMKRLSKMGDGRSEMGGGQLVPLHLPRPLRDPLRGLGLGCLRTRAMTYGHSVISSRA